MDETNSKQSGTLHIHSENILPIIKKWLYSEHDIFIRELASNALDAIVKRKILESKNEIEARDHSLDRIDIAIDAEAKTITISDTGIGMTQDEAIRYLSQIAFSGAEEFMKTYQMKDGFIGHFGLGFFSSFMVSDTVQVTSKSVRADADTIIWKSDGSTTYSIEKAENERAHQGTDVTLFINEASVEYLETYKLKECVRKFCRFFPVPIYLNGEKINSSEPIWTKPARDVTEKEYLDLYRTLYPFQPDPLFWVHINVDYPFHVQGILYFPSQLQREHEMQKGGVQLYCTRVFVSDSCKDILPEYLTMMKGIIDSPDIPLNVSRSHLQVDKTVKTLSSHIVKKVADALVTLSKNDRKKFEEVWPSCEVVVKLGMLEDESFYNRIYDALLFKTVEGSYKKIAEFLQNNLSSEGKKTVIYCDPGQEKSPLVSQLIEKGRDVIITTSALDHPLMSKIERDKKPDSPTEELIFKRIDSSVIHEMLDEAREKTLLDSEGKTEATRIADFFRNILTTDEKSLEVKAQSLSIDTLPAMITLDEEERRTRDYTQRFLQGSDQAAFGQFKPKSTLVINTNNQTIRSIFQAQEKEPKLAEEMARYVLSLARLMHNELSKEEFQHFLQQSNLLLGHVAEKCAAQEG
ncbi:MAG: molecular chaperone HtpG [Chlamydia sp.]